MRNWLKEFGRSFTAGADKAFGVPQVERDFTLLEQRLNDVSVDDASAAQEVLSFLSRHPEQRKDNNFQIFLSRQADKRPGMLKILSERLGLK